MTSAMKGIALSCGFQIRERERSGWEGRSPVSQSPGLDSSGSGAEDAESPSSERHCGEPSRRGLAA